MSAGAVPHVELLDTGLNANCLSAESQQGWGGGEARPWEGIVSRAWTRRTLRLVKVTEARPSVSIRTRSRKERSEGRGMRCTCTLSSLDDTALRGRGSDQDSHRSVHGSSAPSPPALEAESLGEVSGLGLWPAVATRVQQARAMGYGPAWGGCFPSVSTPPLRSSSSDSCLTGGPRDGLDVAAPRTRAVRLITPQSTAPRARERQKPFRKQGTAASWNLGI